MLQILDVKSIRSRVAEVLLACAITLVLFFSALSVSLFNYAYPDSRAHAALAETHQGLAALFASGNFAGASGSDSVHNAYIEDIHKSLDALSARELTSVMQFEVASLRKALDHYEHARTAGETSAEARQADIIINRLEAMMAQHDQLRIHHSVFIFLVGLILGTCIAVITLKKIAASFSEPATAVRGKVQRALENNRLPVLRFDRTARPEEINNIIDAFVTLAKKSDRQVEQLRFKSKLLRKKNRDLRKLNRELDNFLYCTAHDLRSPLTSLLGLLNIMKYENSQDVLKPYFSMMEKSINNMDEFIRQIGGYAGNKHLAIEARTIDLNELVGKVIENHRFAGKSFLIRKDVIIEEEEPCVSDYNRLYIILNNLVSNSIRYADFEKTTPFLRIRIEVMKERFTISFSDNGIGIEDQHLGQIFEMFYRANHDAKGSGLGLFILKETVSRMNGNIFVKSEPGMGTEFILSFPNTKVGFAAAKAG